jgi:2'-5' RNA ligase
MKHVIISYPKLTVADNRWIEAIRDRFQALLGVDLAPHFTFVFPMENIDYPALSEHVRAIVSNFGVIRFVLRCVVSYKDPISQYTYVFLIPDEGFSQIVRLHDRLYSGILHPHLRLDIPYTPHITIGYSADIHYCKAVADLVNTQTFEIRGAIETLEILRSPHSDSNYESLIQIPLRSS